MDALELADENRAARAPMLLVVAGEARTRREIVAYVVGLTAATLVLVVPLRVLGTVYGASAAVPDAVFLALAGGHGRRPSESRACPYLALLFGAMAADRRAS